MTANAESIIPAMEVAEIEAPEPTKCESGSIQAINKTSVHKICSGQVVLNLAIAVKELVENAIDAGATLVEIKLREQGLESVEVSDNGSGVSENDLEAMTAKYHTSKLREFGDLLGVETFGFRGEALASLCALANMTVTTRHADSEVAIKVELDGDGKIKKRTTCCRSVGTTVALSQLFVNLPVRRRDFMRNIKKEFSKMCQILQAYCLVSKGIRIICSNHTTKGGKMVVMQTHGANDLLANVAAVFGVRQSNDLLPLKPAFAQNNENLPTDAKSIGDSTEISQEDLDRLKAGYFKIEGYISSCSHGAGRSSKDRQYFFVNSRPCDPKNIANIVNEVYHLYNVQQYPFVCLNIKTARADVDVNLTPDKRQLLIHNEKLLLFQIKQSLINTFSSIHSQYKMQNTSIGNIFKFEPQTTPEETSLDNSMETPSSPLVPISTSQSFLDVLTQWRRTGDIAGSAPVGRVTNSKRKAANEIEVRTMKMQKIQDYVSRGLSTSSRGNQLGYCKSDLESDNEENTTTSLNESLPNTQQMREVSRAYDLMVKETLVERIDCKVEPLKSSSTLINIQAIASKKFESISGAGLPTTQESQTSNTSNETGLTSLSSIHSSPDFELDRRMTCSKTPAIKTMQLDDDIENKSEIKFSMENFNCAIIGVTLTKIAENLKAEETAARKHRSQVNVQRLRFKSEISPTENENAETELQTEISKTDFVRMDIIGQFNLGFIIVKLDNDLFIVDQHATDEKYNFEVLQQMTTLQSQPLTVPQPLELTAVNEMILRDNLNVFEKNGFKFEFNENAAPMEKVRLLCKPFSKNWEFGKEDIDELIFMLQDAPEGTICRPSRVRAMFASRACRKSVMIGKALKKDTMKTLIRHMGEIEQPWNCPHGRPTCRHLVNIAMLKGDNVVKDGNLNSH